MGWPAHERGGTGERGASSGGDGFDHRERLRCIASQHLQLSFPMVLMHAISHNTSRDAPWPPACAQRLPLGAPKPPRARPRMRTASCKALWERVEACVAAAGMASVDACWNRSSS